MLTLAGEQADIVGLHFKVGANNTVAAEERLESALAQKVEWVRQAAEERARQLQAGGSTVTADVLLASPYWLIGTADEMAEQLIGLRERLGISYVVAREDAFEAFAPVVARHLIATQPPIFRRLRKLRRLDLIGLDPMLLQAAKRAVQQTP